MILYRRLNNLLHPKLGKILMLHRVSASRSNSPSLRQLEVTPSFLEETIISFRNLNYDFIGISDVMQLVKTANHHKPFVCFTFDDGYLDTLTTALPILQRHGVPLCIYLTNHFIDGSSSPHWDSTAPMLSASDLRTLARDPLCTIGAHTLSHPHLSLLTPQQQREEIIQGRQQLEQLVSQPINHFAYPHGDYNQTTINLVREAGFKTAVTCSGRHIRSNSHPLILDRIILQQS
ncbi:MAG: polysaccharide deacetylase family protein [Bacteroidales bacterium]|nr:polysaccharide deacetylase family protein [Bacteroidales bacterium]MBR1799441.1 polysaccharide deacetylase family protein [Bacteroidales bacterium]